MCARVRAGNYTFATATLTFTRMSQEYVLSFLILAIFCVCMSYAGARTQHSNPPRPEASRAQSGRARACVAQTGACDPGPWACVA